VPCPATTDGREGYRVDGGDSGSAEVHTGKIVSGCGDRREGGTGEGGDGDRPQKGRRGRKAKAKRSGSIEDIEAMFGKRK